MLSPLQKLESKILKEKDISLYIKRDDLIHPYISGNKYRKLIYALENYKKNNVKNVLTFGGSYSNHIQAFSYAAKVNNINSIGIIRGEELKNKPLNSTLSYAKENGMKLIFVSRNEYKKRNESEYLKELKEKYNAEILPEGGTTMFSAHGLKDMVDEINEQESNINTIITASGTGGTIAGTVFGLRKEQRAISIPVLKGIEKDIEQKIKEFSSNKNYKIINDYHFGGYAKYNEELVNFIEKFKIDHGIQLEQVYTGKMVYAVFDLIKKNYFKKGEKICIVHTGGLQGLLPMLKNN